MPSLPTLAESTGVDDFMTSMDIAVGAVFVIALIFIAIKKANAPTDQSPPPNGDTKK